MCLRVEGSVPLRFIFFPMNKPYQWCFCYWQVTVVLSYSTVWVGGPYLSDASTSRLTKLLLKFFLFFLMPKCGTESFHFVYSDCKNSSPFYSSFSRLKFFYIFNTMILPFYQWWSQDIFFWDRSRHWPRQRYRDMRRAKTFRIWSRRDKMRLRHSENVRDLRHCRDTGVKTWEEP